MAGAVNAVADTHVVIWYLWTPEELSDTALDLLAKIRLTKQRVGISSITFSEIVYLAEKGRIRSNAFELVYAATSSPDALFEEIPFDSNIAREMCRVPRSLIPDMPDRIVAASARFHHVPVITKDRSIRQSGIATIW
jgi:PIN domain nuclease of toxin-antitoxin system